MGDTKMFVIFLFLAITAAFGADISVEEESSTGRYTIEGKVLFDPLFNQPNWQANTRIHVNGGEHLGFIREDGTFLIHNVPPGSYIVEVLNQEFTYEPVRVEINTKGKFRARKVNHIQTSLVIQVPYPLRMKPLGITKYFQLREQWMITDFLFNPMILMMVLPLLLIMVLPKMMNDPETKKELEQIRGITKFDMPEVSDMVTNFFAGSSPQQNQAGKKVTKTKKRQ
ncbi:PREDICTED: ER membrane protein complex subunit 7 homolog [Nicrophorus vespilloides]|uniref:ER membrane protein complex subunit 7 homolog n=1 Tax=Nicrophorus vespilloides TaxID=110193 RepID=A0ABM1NEB3_NICVS|nr:PREDICTED: ER membrane protein complex subunit 7 homolog [Nicrophorus vespilloides]